MKHLYDILKRDFPEASTKDRIEMLEVFFQQLANTSTKFIDISLRFTSYGCYKSVPFVNEYHTGVELAQILNISLKGKLCHDEEHVFKIADFKETIQERLWAYLLN